MKKLLGCLMFFAQGAFANTISITDATYGANCPAVPFGNVTQQVRSSCEGRSGDCNYYVSHHILGDPAPGCAKDFEVRYRCGDSNLREFVFREASGRTAFLKCESNNTQPQTSGIRVITATYGGNGGAGTGNVSGHIRQQCDGFHSCHYVIDHNKLGDPVPYFAKDYRVTYDCGDNIQRSRYRLPEATGKTVVLTCD